MASDFGPLFRRTDPRSSREAAQRLKACGKWGSDKRKVYDAIVKSPGCTSEEIAWDTGLVAYVVRKRTADLRNAGLVVDNRETLRRGQCLRWWPTDESTGDNAA